MLPPPKWKEKCSFFGKQDNHTLPPNCTGKCKSSLENREPMPSIICNVLGSTGQPSPMGPTSGEGNWFSFLSKRSDNNNLIFSLCYVDGGSGFHTFQSEFTFPFTCGSGFEVNGLSTLDEQKAPSPLGFFPTQKHIVVLGKSLGQKPMPRRMLSSKVEI